MIQVAPASFPEPAKLPAASSAKARKSEDASGSSFEALLDSPAGTVSTEKTPVADKATNIPPDAAKSSAPDSSADAVPDEASAPAEPGDAEQKLAGDKEPEEADAGQLDGAPAAPNEVKASDTAMLSSQLAMWQILPPPVPVAPADPVKVADSSAGLTAPVATEVVAGNSFLRINQPSLPAQSSAPQNPLASPATPPTPPTLAAATQVVADAPASRLPAEAAPQAPIGTPAKPLTVATKLPEPTKAASPAGAESTPANPAPAPAEVVSRSVSPGNGIPAAKQQRVMSDQEVSPTPAPATAGFAGSKTDTILPEAIAAMDSSSTGEKFQDSADGEQSHEPAPGAFTAPMLAAEHKLHTTPAAENAPTLHAADAAKVISQIERAVERLRNQEGQRIEMRLPLHDGSEVVVKLQLEAGQLKAVFRTESGELRDALATGWSQFASTSPERTLKLGAAVFESPSMQSGMNGFSQTPDQRNRQQAFADAENTLNPPNPTRTALKPAAIPTQLAPPTRSDLGLQLYA